VKTSSDVLWLDPGDVLDSAVGYGLHERVVVTLVLVGVAGGEIGDGGIEGVVAAEVFGDGDRVAGSGMGAGKSPATHSGVEPHRDRWAPWHVTKAEFYAADAVSMEFFRSEEDPIGELLPVNSVLGAFILRGDMHTNADEWMLLEDLKRLAAE
jgi:hypothetical protein